MHGGPLLNWDVIPNYIRTTTTTTVLTVEACLLNQDYPTGIQITE